MNKDKTPVIDQKTGKPEIVKPLITYWTNNEGIEVYTFRKLTGFLKHWLKPVIDYNIQISNEYRALTSPLLPRKIADYSRNITKNTIINQNLTFNNN